jgi:hypothetical protein
MSPGKHRTTALDNAREKPRMSVEVTVNIRISTVKNVANIISKIQNEFK